MREGAPKAVTAIGLALQEQIGHGLLTCGSQLPSERKLSELFATTRLCGGVRAPATARAVQRDSDLPGATH